MKSKKSYLNFIVLIIIALTSCKKETPKPTGNTIIVNYSGTDTTINVLASNSYDGTARVTAKGNSNVAVYINSDMTVKLTPAYNYYGIDTLTYSINDNSGDPGASKGLLIVRRGTDAQINTVSVFTSCMSDNLTYQTLSLYAVNGDTSGLYNGDYNSTIFIYDQSRKLTIYSNGVTPDTEKKNYAVVGDGNVVANYQISGVFVMQNIQNFSASARKRDGSGYVTLKGLSFEYAGDRLDFTNRLPQ